LTEISDLLDDDTVTKITNLKISNVDLVKRAANGRTFLLRKSADESNPSIFDAEQVREFAKQALEGDMTDAAPDEAVAKADDEILEDAPAGAEGDENDPGSPAWEAIDAATAWSQLSLLSDVKRALTALSQREAEEAFNGDDDGYDNSWDLLTASELVDAAIAIVAPYAVGEQDESEQPVEKSELSPREVLADFVKAGRSLSAANESALRGAAAAISNVLASLPPVDESVAKGEELTEEQIFKAEIDAERAADVTKAATSGGTLTVKLKADASELKTAIAKAKSDPQVLVYDAIGNVIGSVDPTNLTTFANSASPDAPADDTADAPDDAPADASPDAAPADSSADPEVADVAPDAAPDAAVIPGTNTVQSPVETDDKTVTKANTTEIADAFKEALTPFAKQLEENSGLADVVKGLQERLEKMGQLPDDRKSPRLNGATGTGGDVHHDANVDQFAVLRKAVAEAKTQDEIIKSQQALAHAELLERFSH
jgi:hypothetical protein